MSPTEDSRGIANMPLAEFGLPRVLLVAEPHRRAEALAAIQDVGATADGPVLLEHAPAKMRRRDYHAMLVEIADDQGDALDELLDAIEEAAADGARGVVTFPAALIDAVTARVTAPAIALLCEPTGAERQGALALAMVDSARMLRDVGADGAVRLRELSEEVGRIARKLASLSIMDGAARLPGADVPPSRCDPGAVVAPGTVRTIIRLRRMRGHYFDATLFADPAWDMLLDLTAARLEGAPVAVSSLCIAAAVPPTTALRWIKSLTDVGLLVRVADPQDRRRVFIELGEDTARQMLGYVAATVRVMRDAF